MAVLFINGCKNKNTEALISSRFNVTSPVKKDTIIFKDYVCQVRSIQHIELRALEKGYLQAIFVDEGQFVKKGQLMFQIMPLVYQAEMEKAEAEAEFAEIEYQNTKNLADSNIVSKNELALSKARFNKAKAELSLAKAHLGFTEIHAPFDGIMDRFNVRLGSLVDEGELLSTLSDNSKMWVYFNVPEVEYLNYAIHSKHDSLSQVKLKMANDEMFEYTGIVETIEADFNNETGNISFRATFPNPDKLLRHGETGNILMPVVLKNALLVPEKAVFEILDKKYVFVVDEKNVIHSKEITVGTELPHLSVVTSGLTDKDKILIEGLRKVRNNQTVRTRFISQEKVLSEMKNLHAE
ncbi:MAG TPA: efflux RND transporter periplasmic adaptor subunit [Flavobacteriales bacterium]|nr:efflux RND transporter periplasmic adaptor subunit [Flavobacteriales bacterium]